MILPADHPVWKYTIVEDGKRVCRSSAVPADILDEIRDVDRDFFECNGSHLVTFED
ncbi:hypothetical protein [Victivallis vadensis]|mgnify:FL=1|uniref:hypothetical protein n=1 Tax=Victivallis vadensis TaxID=172901 RepID=UPI003D023D42